LNSVVLRWDPSGKVKYLNEYGQKLFGFSNQEIIGKPVVGTIIAETDAAGRDLKHMIEDIVKNPEKYKKNENENITKDGQRLWMSWRNKPIRNSDGTLKEILTAGYDITEKKQEEKALEENRALLENTLNNLPAAVFLKTTDGRAIFVNQKYEETYDVALEDIKGKTVYDYFPKKVADNFSAQDKKIVENREVINEDSNKKIDDTTRDFAKILFPVFDANDEMVAFGGIELDITERKQAEHALRDRQELFDTILDNMPALVYLRDTDGRFLLINRSYEELFQVTRAQALGRSLHEVFSKERADEYAVADSQVANQGKIIEREEIHQLSDGEHIMSVVRFPIFGQSDEVVAVGGIDLDITERKQAEQHQLESQKLLDSILDNMPFTVFVRDLDGRFMLINRRYEELEQVAKADVLGKALHELFPKEQADDYAKLDSEVARQREVLEREETHQFSDGEHFMSVVKFPIFDLADEVVAVGGIDLDITERKRAVQKLAEREEQLRVAISGMPSGIVYTDEDLNIVFANDRLAEMYGAPTELFEAGRPYADFFRYLAEEGFFGRVDPDAFVAQRIEDLRNPSGEVSDRQTPDGRLFEIRRQPVHGGGAITVVTDVTEERQAADKINRQAEVLLEMSTPITEIWNGILLLPVIGELDRDRARKIMNAVLERITLTSSKIVILDISGLSTVDEEVLPHIIMIADAMRLMGSQCIISGVSPTNAKLIVDLGIDVDALFTVASIREALALGIKRLEDKL
jgi:PAS domain S-box-containing protein